MPSAVNEEVEMSYEAVLDWLQNLRPSEARDLVMQLSDRQRTLLIMAACGIPGDECSVALNISKGTVSTERANTLAILGVPRLQVACIVACKAGLL